MPRTSNRGPVLGLIHTQSFLTGFYIVHVRMGALSQMDEDFDQSTLLRYY